MKVAVIGIGKTGSKVAELLEPDQIAGTFDSNRQPETEQLAEADVAIIFVPGKAVHKVFDTVLDAEIPAVWGSTGFNWPENLDQRLKEKNLRWLKASNFSLGMNIIRRCIREISESSEFLSEPGFHIHEIHHTGKEDAPSGTAISWKNWLGKEVKITSERKGDIKGVHQLHLKTESESIWLKHEAHDRKVFAEGAIWAARKLLEHNFNYGLLEFSEIFDELVTSKTK